MRTKKQKGVGYISALSMLSIVTGFAGGIAFEMDTGIWRAIFALMFSLCMFRIMFLVVEIDLFFTRNFDDKPVVDVEKEFSSGLSEAVHVFCSRLGKIFKRKEDK